MEFLLGRLLGNCLLNLGIRDMCREALAEMGIDLEEIEELEEDGNQVVVHWMYGPMLLEETKDNCLVYKVLFPQYISKYASEEDRKNITKKYPLEATGFSLFAYGNPIKHFSYLYSDK